VRFDRLLGLSARAIVVIAALESLWLVYLLWIQLADPLGQGFPFRYQVGGLVNAWAAPSIAILVIGWFVDGLIASRVIQRPRGGV
jgi:hypothetical protein